MIEKIKKMQTAAPPKADRSGIPKTPVSNTNEPSETSDHQGEGVKPATKRAVETAFVRGEGEVFVHSKLIVYDQLEICQNVDTKLDDN